MMKVRVEWIDAARGLGILLVVLGHSYMAPSNEVNKLILSFHMPLFFFLSGICVKQSIRKEKVSEYLKRKAYSLMMPHLTLGIIFLVWDLIFTKENLQLIVYTAFSNWFLLVLMWVDIVFYILLKLNLYRKNFEWCWIVGLFMLGILLDSFEFEMFLHFEIVPMALSFFLLGGVSEHFIEGKQLFFGKSIFFLIPLFIITAGINQPVRMYENTYGQPILFLVSAVTGILIISMISKLVCQNSYLIWLGKNSIYFYVLHFKLLSVLRGVAAIVFQKETLYFIEYPLNWIIFILSLLIMDIVTIICNRYLYVLFGRKKERKICEEMGND